MSTLDSIDPSIIGERLKQARVDAGITQEIAAQKIGIARTTIVAIEKGQRKVRSNEFVNLSKLYNISARTLLSPSKPEVESIVRYRKDPRIQGRAKKSQEAVTLLLELANASFELEEILGQIRIIPEIPSYPILKRDVRTQAEDAALSLRQYLGIGLAPIVDIFTLIEIELGIRVFTRPIDSNISGVYIHDERLGHCVLLNSKHPITRRANTATHELGHAVSVPEHIDIWDAEHSESPREERFATQFAIMFLMPPRTIRKQFDVFKTKGVFSGYNLLAMANTFNVSPYSMCLQLEQLGLLKQGTYDSIKERGFSPKPLRLSADEHYKLFLPLRTSLLAADALSNGFLSEGQLSKMFKLDRIEFRKVMDAIEYEGIQ